MPVALKAQFIVTAGIVPGQAMDEFTKAWHYTAEDHEKDVATPKDQETIFTRYMREAHDYAQRITDPSSLNFVRVDFVWM